MNRTRLIFDIFSKAAAIYLTYRIGRILDDAQKRTQSRETDALQRDLTDEFATVQDDIDQSLGQSETKSDAPDRSALDRLIASEQPDHPDVADMSSRAALATKGFEAEMRHRQQVMFELAMRRHQQALQERMKDYVEWPHAQTLRLEAEQRICERIADINPEFDVSGIRLPQMMMAPGQEPATRDLDHYRAQLEQFEAQLIRQLQAWNEQLQNGTADPVTYGGDAAPDSAEDEGCQCYMHRNGLFVPGSIFSLN